MHSHNNIVLGVAAIGRKLYSPQMQAILASLRRTNPNFHLILLDDIHMNNQPITQWPIVHVLLTLYSTTFPLRKVLQYVSLRSPLLINNLHMQRFIMDRRDIRRLLARAAVPIPPAVSVDRVLGDSVSQTPDGNTLFVHSPSRGCSFTIEKPFVEKPVDPDDHNIHIYYKDGGIRKLFRKVKNTSSSYLVNATTVRQTGSYVYEQFFEPQQRSDVKVYAVGDYFHAEARKAPHIDGVVDRDQFGHEQRVPVSLSLEERDICRRVTSAFGQFVIGFDLLRGPSHQRFIIDVNGWSLVKNSEEYTLRCGRLLAERIVEKLRERDRHTASDCTSPIMRTAPQPSPPQSTPELFDSTPSSAYPCLALAPSSCIY